MPGSEGWFGGFLGVDGQGGPVVVARYNSLSYCFLMLICRMVFLLLCLLISLFGCEFLLAQNHKKTWWKVKESRLPPPSVLTNDEDLI